MATVRFYHPINRGEVRDLSSDYLTSDFTLSESGSLEGSVTFELDSSNSTFLKATKENSHFIYLSVDGKSVGGIIEDSWAGKNADEKGMFTVKFCGFKEYLEKIVIILSEKTALYGGNTAVRRDDLSGSGNFYAFGPEGLLLELLRNLEEQMNADGYSRFWNYGNLESFVESMTSANWTSSYRLNSLEAPTFSKVWEDIAGDESIGLVKISPNVSDGFRWSITIDTTNTDRQYDNREDDLFEIQFSESDDRKRAKAVATGTSLKDQSLISIIEFDDSVAYSHLVSDSPAENTSNLRPFNVRSIRREQQNLGQVSVNSYRGSMANLYDIMEISSKNLTTFRFVVTEISYNEKVFTYTGNLISGVSLKKGKKAANPLTRRLFKPVRVSDARSRDNAFRREGPTGWRSAGD